MAKRTEIFPSTESPIDKIPRFPSEQSPIDKIPRFPSEPTRRPPRFPTDKIEEEMNADHLSVEIKDTDGQDLSGLQATNKSANPATIFKVNMGLCESNPAAYTPKLISIGPYHNKNPKLRAMEKYKQLYLQRFLNRKEGIDKISCMRELEKLKNKALMCYDDTENFDKDIIDKFSEIMLLDGCFVVEFVRERGGNQRKDYQKVIYKSWMKSQVCRDMVVLENQLPFFVLTMLHDMTKCSCSNEESFLYMVRRTLLSISPKVTYKPKPEIDRLNAEPFDHLLHVLHVVSCPSGMIKSSEDTDASKKKGSNLWNSYFIPNATELYEAGVSFTKIGSVEEDAKDTTNFLDINFEKGLLEIPCFVVQGSTEIFIRNVIAFEQHSYNINPYFSHYARIMSQLINSHKDVHLLRNGGIILDRLGDDTVMANIFNKLGDGVTLTKKFYYKEVCSKLNQHCRKPWNKLMANLRHNYFQSPWAGASTVGAIILLILTTIQTVLTFTGSVK